MTYKDATPEQIESSLQGSWKAFRKYRNTSLAQRADLMHGIALAIEALGDQLIEVAKKETNLPEARLRSEKARTIFQLNSYRDATVSANWMDLRIDTAIPDRNPPKPDLRKMMVPLGPVVVFGAANFPFAYSTAGGDTACALAAGCPVIVKAHPAHAETSELVAGAIHSAIKKCGLPVETFIHLHGQSFDVGRALIQHPNTRAVGFTGSFAGGKQLFDWANQRPIPIPVFAEMSSINPVFLLPGKLKESALEVAKLYAGSITLGVGQFCTNPGLLIGLEGEALQSFINALGSEISKTTPATMLHPGIAQNYLDKRQQALNQTSVELVAEATEKAGVNQGLATIATVSARAYLENPLLHQEVFGPYSLIIRCSDIEEMTLVANKMEGQLTGTLMANNEDLNKFPELIESVKNICGRFILNSVPTGVEVCMSMQHGGPFPSTTDSRFTSVGSDGVKRFVRPLTFQNWPDEHLPDELKNANPLDLWRMVNNRYTKESLLVY